MLDLRFVLENVELVRKNARARNAIVDIDLVVMLHGVLKDARHELDETNHESNLLADRFKGADDATRRTLRHESATLRERAARLREAVALHERAFMEEFTKIPNLCAPDVPDGLDERGNVAVKHVGAPTRFAFKPRDDLAPVRFDDALRPAAWHA
jgi:seryl-tRNA synthetase